MDPEKCQVINLGEKTIPESFSVDMPEVTLPGATLDKKLNFNSHTSNISKEASKNE